MQNVTTTAIPEKRLMPLVQLPRMTKDRTECLASGELLYETRIRATRRIPISRLTGFFITLQLAFRHQLYRDSALSYISGAASLRIIWPKRMKAPRPLA